MGDLPMYAWHPRKGLKILEACGRGPYCMMLKELFDYTNAEYKPSIRGLPAPYGKYVDLQNMPYALELDVVLTSDVFEHVREDRKAFAEIYRSLKPGGAMVMTVPFSPDLMQTMHRVRIDGDKDILLMEPEYHGGGGQTLMYRLYGWDILDLLTDVGFTVGYMEMTNSSYGITPQYGFIGIKDSGLDLGLFARVQLMEQLPRLELPLFRLFRFLKWNMASLAHFWGIINKRH